MGLTDKLMEILDSRKKKLSGQDIKHIVESIEISKRIEQNDIDNQEKRDIEEQQKAYIKLGKDYFGGD